MGNNVHMELESYFDFFAGDDIRLKGSRIGIESVLYEYIHRNKSAEQIAERFPTLTLAQIHATILYYLNNRETVDAYLVDWLNFSRQMREQQAANPSSAVLRLREIKAANSVLISR